MLKRKVQFIYTLTKKHFHNSSRNQYCRQQEFENPFKRTWRILKNDIRKLGGPDPSELEKERAMMGLFPRYADVVIIGGGGIGSAVAYWLKEKTARDGLSVVVIEKDPTYSKCSTALSVGGLRQQFSLAENIQMSLYGAEFLRTLKKRFGPEADVCFTPNGYLVLASENGAQQLIDNFKLQKQLGAISEVLTKDQLKQRFPWMNVSDVELGCLGLENEGWFDPWALLNLLKYGAQNMGTQYVQGEVVDFMFRQQHDFVVEGMEDECFEQATDVVVKMSNGEHKAIQFSKCVIAAGADSGDLSQLAKIGSGRGILSVPLPVEKRKRYVFRFDCQGEPPGINSPLTIDYTGAYFRRDGLGGSFIGGISPLPEEEPSTDNLDVDHSFFDEKLWPILANRVPAFNCVKVKSAWGGFYEYNHYDENGIVGPHPYHSNIFFATGFSGHGIQQAPAVGRAIAELILDCCFETIDLSKLGFDRLIAQKPMYEIGIY